MPESTENRGNRRSADERETWELFICYRQLDGRDAAAWLHHTLSGHVLPFIPEGYNQAPQLRVYFDQAAPAVDDWTRIHQPALARARALLFVCSPGARERLDANDWVHSELDWWLANREAAPILIDPTGEGDRYLPASVRRRWPNAQRLLVQPGVWARLPPEERERLESNVRERIIGGIRESERATTYQDLEREKERARQLEQQRKRLTVYLLAAVLALALATAAAIFGIHQQRMSQREAMKARASLALTTAASARDPLASALLVISAGEMLGAARLPLPSGGTGVAHRIARTPRPRALTTHAGIVSSASFSSDGRRIVSASLDGTAHVWRVDGRGKTLVLRGHEPPILNAVFSPDGRRVVTASGDGTARMWDASDGTPLFVLRGHADGVLSAAFSPDGRRVVTASEDGTARIWNAETGDPAVLLEGHEDAVEIAAFDSTGRRVVTGSADGTVRVWNTDGSGEPVVLEVPLPPSPNGIVWVVPANRPRVTSVAFSPNGRRVAAASQFHGTFVWNADGSERPTRLSGPATSAFIVSTSFSPDGRLVATVSDDGVTTLSKVDGPVAPPRTLGQPSTFAETGPIGGPAAPRVFSPDGTRVLNLSREGLVKIWSLDGPAEPLVLTHPAAVSSAEFSPDGTHVVTASVDGTSRVWTAHGSDEPLVLRGHTSHIEAASFSHDGQRVVTAAADGSARVWRLDGPDSPVVLGDHGADVVGAAFSSEGTSVVTVSRNGRIKFWTIQGSLLRTIEGERPVTAVAFSSDRRSMLTLSVGHTVILWNLQHGTAISLGVFQHDLLPPIFSDDGDRVLSVGPGGAMRAWSVTGAATPISVLPPLPSVVGAVLSQDGRVMLTLSRDGRLRIRSAETGVETILNGVPSTLLSSLAEDRARYRDRVLDFVAFATRDKRVALSLRDRVVHVWNDYHREPAATIPTSGFVRDLMFSPDGRQLLIGSATRVRIWDLDRRGDPLELDSDSPLGTVSFDRAGDRLLTASGNVVRIWRLGWDLLAHYLKRSTTACLTSGQRTQWLAESTEEANAAASACETGLRE